MNYSYKNILIYLSKYALGLTIALFLFLWSAITAGVMAQQVYTVTNKNSSGNGSLRWAINQANGYTGPGKPQVRFNIAGTGPHLILLARTDQELSRLQRAMIIDGRTQSGYSAGSPQIIIDGSQINRNPFQNPGSIGLTMELGGSEIYGLEIREFRDAAIVVGFAAGQISNFVVRECILHTIVGGGFFPSNGLSVTDGVNGIIRDNKIGVLRDGTAAGTAEHGVEIRLSSNIEIIGNTITDNANHGIRIFEDNTNIRIEDNFIGLVSTNPLTPTGNAEFGVYIGDNSTGVEVINNAIGFGSGGIFLEGNSSGNTFTGNDYYCLSSSTVQELASGANGNLAPPVISSAGCTSVTGTAPAGAIIDIYEILTCSTNSSLRDYLHLGTTTATGTAWSFNPGTNLAGKELIATSTDSQGSTSHFSVSRTATNSSPSTPVFVRTDGATPSIADQDTMVTYHISSPQTDATYTWSVSNTTVATFQGSNVSDTITINWGAWVSGPITLTASATNACGGNPVQYSRNIYLRPPTTSINGPDTVNAGTVDPPSVFSVASRIGSSYSWLVPSGSTILSGQGSDAITVQFGNAGGNVSVRETNGVAGLTQTKTVVVRPVTPLINGANYAEVNPGQTGFYNVAFSSGSTYEWSVVDAQGQPVPGVDLGTFTSRSISIGWPSTLPSQRVTLRVTETNNQGITAANTSTFEVAIKPLAPVIFGAETAGEGSDEVYQINLPVAGLQYVWSFDPENAATFLTADRLPQRTVRWGMIDAAVVVRAFTPDSIFSDPASLAVDVVPGPTTSPIIGPTNVNGKETYTYSVTGDAGNTFHWTLPLGAKIVSENSIASTVDIRFGNTGGSVSVVETNELGVSGITQSLDISLTPQPSPVLGTVNPKIGEEVVFSVDFTEGSTYSWTVTPVAGSLPASNTAAATRTANVGIQSVGNIFSFIFNDLGQNVISLVETTIDGFTLPIQTLTVDVVSDFVIEGPIRVLPGTPGITYRVPANFSGVEWSVSSGEITPVSGSTGTSFTVNFGQRGGLIQAVRREGSSIVDNASVYVETSNPGDYQARVKIINSQNFNPFDLADERFLAASFNQGHRAEIVSENILNSQAFLGETDVLIIPTPQVELTPTRIENLRIAYIEYGMSIAIIGEHNEQYYTNSNYIDLIEVINPDRRFNWRPGEPGIQAMTVKGTIATTRQQIEQPINAWYSLYGAGNSSSWEYFLKKGRNNVGSLFKEDGACGGKLLHVTDSDFLKNAGESTDLVLNIVDEMAAKRRLLQDPELLLNSPKGTSQQFEEVSGSLIFENYESVNFSPYTSEFNNLSGWTTTGSWQVANGSAKTVDYENGQVSELISPEILLDSTLVPEEFALRGFAIQYDYSLESESTWDMAQVYMQVENNGSFGEWVLMSQSSGKSEGTRLKSIPLRDPKLWGKRIRIKFTFDTDECIRHFEGWEIQRMFVKSIYTNWSIQTALVQGQLAPPQTQTPPLAPITPGTRTLLPNGVLEIVPNTPFLFRDRFELQQEGILLENNCQVKTMVIFDANAGGIGGIIRGYDDVNVFQQNLDRLKTLLENTGQGECKQFSYLAPGGRQSTTYTFFTDPDETSLFSNATQIDLEDIFERITSLKAERPGEFTFRSPLGSIYDFVINKWDQFPDVQEPNTKYNIYFYNPEGDVGIRGFRNDRILTLSGEQITFQTFKDALASRGINFIVEGSKLDDFELYLNGLSELADFVFSQEVALGDFIPKNKRGFNLVDIAKNVCDENDEPCCEGNLASDEEIEDCCDLADANTGEDQASFETLPYGGGAFDNVDANIASTNTNTGSIPLVIEEGMDLSYIFESAAVTPANIPPDNSDLYLGNPDNAEEPTSNFLDISKILLEKRPNGRPAYVLSYNGEERINTPNWAAWHFQNNDFQTGRYRISNFGTDNTLPEGVLAIEHEDYTCSGFDRGHVCDAAARSADLNAYKETFLMTNMVPQAPRHNQNLWRKSDWYLRRVAGAGYEMYVISGRAGTGGYSRRSRPGGTGVVGFKNEIQSRKDDDRYISVPAQLWKVAVIIPEGDNDYQRLDQARVITIITPNDGRIGNEAWYNPVYRNHTINDVNALIGGGFDILRNITDPTLKNYLANYNDYLNLPNLPDIQGKGVGDAPSSPGVNNISTAYLEATTLGTGSVTLTAKVLASDEEVYMVNGRTVIRPHTGDIDPGTVLSVTFFIDGNPVGSVEQPDNILQADTAGIFTYTLDWLPAGPGEYKVTATAMLKDSTQRQTDPLLYEMISQERALGEIEVYPNPFSGGLNVMALSEVDRAVTFRMMDNTGRIIAEFHRQAIQGVNEFHLVTENLPSGLYHMLILSEGDNLSKMHRVIKIE